MNDAVTLLASIVVLLLLTLFGLPTWPYSRRWTYYPSAALGFVTISIVLLIVAGRL